MRIYDTYNDDNTRCFDIVIYISSKLSESCLEVVCAGIYLDLKN